MTLGTETSPILTKPVLIVEDDNWFQCLIKEAFNTIDIGWEADFIFVEDGKKALTVLHNRKIDLIITDIFMPNVDGYELIEKVRQVYPDLPIIAVSADEDILYQGIETLEIALQIGANYSIPKSKLISLIPPTVKALF